MKLPWYTQQKPAVVLVAGLGGLFTVVNLACAQPWATTDAPNLIWNALAMSADGTRLVAAAGAYTGGGPVPPAPIWISTDAGAAWTQTSAPSNHWLSVACSADGAKWVAVSSPFPTSVGPKPDGLIYTSPDAGATWSPASAPSNTWSAVASSADGRKLVAVTRPQYRWDGTNWDCIGEGAIYRSSDAGATWTRATAPSNGWRSVASSADGTKLVALAGIEYLPSPDRYFGDGLIYCSPDSGATWTRTSAPSTNWTCVASSADGTKLVAAAGDYYDREPILISTNSGVSWTAPTAPSGYWTSVACSADGVTLVAAQGWSDDLPGLIFLSTDSGATWTSTLAPGSSWSALACSADGYRIVAAPPWGRIYTLPYSGSWRLAAAPPRPWRGWESVACSADGTRLIAVESWPGLCTSGDSGATWSRTSAPTNSWQCVASAADGARLVAAADPNGGDGLIYTSSNSGATWAATSARSNSWTSLASSADGTQLVAVAAIDPNYGGDGLVYTSSTSGVTWAPTTAPSNTWTSVACSADGIKWVAVSSPVDMFGWPGGDGLIYTSSDRGASWAPTSAPSNGWSSVATSSDGTKLVAVAKPYLGRSLTNYAGDGAIFCSADAGATWRRTGAPSNGWSSVASSADGSKLVALTLSYWNGGGEGAGEVFISTNSGDTWTPAVPMPAADSWFAIASSADGCDIVAVGDGVIGTLRSPTPAPPLPPSPRLVIERPGPNSGLSWLVPSIRFVLQQSSDLHSGGWADVPTSPTLDLTNLHHRVLLAPSLGSRFYRLKQQ